jgi:hypothetical protein
MNLLTKLKNSEGCPQLKNYLLQRFENSKPGIGQSVILEIRNSMPKASRQSKGAVTLLRCYAVALLPALSSRFQPR